MLVIKTDKDGIITGLELKEPLELTVLSFPDGRKEFKIDKSADEFFVRQIQVCGGGGGKSVPVADESNSRNVKVDKNGVRLKQPSGFVFFSVQPNSQEEGKPIQLDK